MRETLLMGVYDESVNSDAAQGVEENWEMVSGEGC